MSWDINVEKIKKNDRAHFEHVFNICSRELYVFAYRIVGDKAVAEDIVQDFFVKLWLTRSELCSLTSFRSYCYTSVYHISLNVLRTKNRHAELNENIAASTDIQFEMERADLRCKLDKAIATLPEKCKEIFIEICVDGNSYAETAEKYNLSVNTIKVQISKAYRILREELSRDEKLLLLLWCIRRHIVDVAL